MASFVARQAVLPSILGNELSPLSRGSAGCTPILGLQFVNHASYRPLFMFFNTTVSADKACSIVTSMARLAEGATAAL